MAAAKMQTSSSAWGLLAPLLVLVFALPHGTSGKNVFGIRPQLRILLVNDCIDDVQILLSGPNLWEQYVQRAQFVFGELEPILYIVEEPLPNGPLFTLPAGATLPRLVLTDNNTNQIGPYVYEGAIDVAAAGVPFRLPADYVQIFGTLIAPPQITYIPAGGGRFVLTPRLALYDPREITAPAVVEIVITCAPATPAPTAAPLMNTALVNVTNTCPVPVGISLQSNEADYDIWQQYNPATGLGTPIVNNRLTIAPGATQANLLLLNSNPSGRVKALPRSGAITAFNPALGPPNLVTGGIPDQLTIQSFDESIEPNVTTTPGGPGLYVLDPFVVGNSDNPVAPAEVAVNVYCSFLTPAVPPAVTVPPASVAPPAGPVTPLTSCNDVGGGNSLQCPALSKPPGTGCVCGGYIGGLITSPSVCQANVQCGQCTTGCNNDTDCPFNHNCGVACGGVGPSAAVTMNGRFRGLCLPNCGLTQPLVGAGC